MKTTFAELDIGQRFHYNIDANGHEPYLYKINDSEAYVERGSHSGLREVVEPGADVWTWSEPIILNNYITEIERAAITLLFGSGGNPRCDHPGLSEYIRALAADPDEIRTPDQFIFEADAITEWDVSDENEIIPLETRPLRDVCQEAGFVCWTSEWDRDNSAFGAILDHKPRGTRPDTKEQRYLVAVTDAAARLAYSIRDYRIAGRPVGDQTHTIMGMGAPLLNVTTSLAAAIAEYHNRILNIYARDNMDLEGALRSALPDDLITQSEAAAIANVTPQAINNAIRERRLRAYSSPDAVSHRPGARQVSEADVRELWPPRA